MWLTAFPVFLPMANRNPPGYRSPRQKEQRPVQLHHTLKAVIQKEAAVKNTTIEAVIAERFGVQLPERPTTAYRTKATTRPRRNGKAPTPQS
jgi:hypothetical protein